MDAVAIVEALRGGQRAALAQAISTLERGHDDMRPLIAALEPHLGHAAVVGFTGPPGAGKSTLVNALIAHWRSTGRTVGVIAVDPSSPLSGGAILGDRIRMTAAQDDDGVFVRSLASRGHLGGVSPDAVRIIDAFDAAGYDIVLIETVGTGQNEIDIASVADVGVVIAAPGLGDDIQAMKAGLLEIADVLVVNKADRPGAEQTAQQLAGALSLKETTGELPKILKTVATSRDGVGQLASEVERIKEIVVSQNSAADRRLKRGRYILQQIAMDAVRDTVSRGNGPVIALVQQVLAGDANEDDITRQLFEIGKLRGNIGTY